MKSFAHSRIAAIVTVATVLASCGGGASSAAPSSAQATPSAPDASAAAPTTSATASAPLLGLTLQSLSVSASDWPAFIADKRGIFAEQGLVVDFVTLVDAPSAAAALEGGDYDAANVTLSNMGPLITQGRQFRLIAQDWTMSQVLLAHKDSAARSLSDVFPLGKDTPVGTASLGGEVTKVWRNLQAAYGGDIDDVNVQVDPGGAALLSGAVQFGLLNPNIACVLKSQGAIEIFDPANPGDASQYPEGVQRLSSLHTNGYWATGAWVKEHPDTVSRLQAALMESIEWIKGNPAETASLLRGSDFDLPTLSDAEFEACVASIAPTFSSTFPTDGLDDWTSFLQTVGDIEQGLPPIDEWLHPGVPRQ